MSNTSAIVIREARLFTPAGKLMLTDHHPERNLRRYLGRLWVRRLLDHVVGRKHYADAQGTVHPGLCVALNDGCIICLVMGRKE